LIFLNIMPIINVVNRQTAYRIEALLELAHAHPAPVRVAELARRRRIPRPFLARLLTELAHAGVVVTVRGPAGGVSLARPPAQVSLKEIVTPEPAPAFGGAAVQHVATLLGQAREQALASLTLAALAEEERRATGVADFEI